MADNDVTPAHRSADPAASVLPWLRRAVPPAAVIIMYLLIGIVAFWPVFPGVSQHLFGVEGDYTQSVWYLAWIPHALGHGLNPFFSNAMYVPTGVNLAFNTSSPLLGLAAAPFAAAFSPVVSANLLMLLAMPVSAAAAFVVLRKWAVWMPAAAMGGFAYGFSPYMVGQSLAHVDLVFVPIPPFIALTVVSILQRRGSPRRLGIQLGLLVEAQYLISPEVLTMVAFFTVAALACLAIGDCAHLREMASALAVPAGIAVCVAIVLLACPLWMQVAGPQLTAGRRWPINNPFHTDLLSFVAPGVLQKVSLGLRSLWTRVDVSIGAAEAGGYIGIPVLIVTAILAWRSRRSPRTQLTVLLLCAAILSLGPYLAVNGKQTRFPLPFLLWDHIPQLYNILLSRICFEVGAFLAAVIAFGLDDMHRSAAQADRRGPARGWWAGGRGAYVFTGVTLAVLVVTQLPQ